AYDQRNEDSILHAARLTRDSLGSAMWDTIRLGAILVAFVALAVCFAAGWTRTRLALANRDPRIPAHEFNGLKKAHYTPTGQQYLRQAQVCLTGFLVSFVVALALGLLGKPL